MSDIEDLSNNNSSYQRLQPERYRNSLPKWRLMLHKIDIFSAIPTPKTYPVSTRRSLIGTFIFIFLFTTYIISSFVFFIIDNVPRLNEYSQLDDSDSLTVGPEIAMQFLYGKDVLNESITNTSIFSITMQQVIKYLDPAKQDNSSTQIPLKICYSSDIEWMPENASKLAFLCPEVQLNLSGQLYKSEEFIYPRIQIDYCPYFHPEKKLQCETEAQIRKTVAGGRLFLYIKNQAPEVNFVGKKTQGLKYQVFQYFLVPGLYNRAEIVLQKQLVSMSGDYLTQFSTKHDEFLLVNRQYLYVTNVSQNDVGRQPTDSLSIYKGYQIFLRLDQEIKIIQVVKDTIIDVIAQWGAFYGVLVGAFALYFLKYNQNQFYEKNKQWANFDQNEALFESKQLNETEVKSPID
ncbi:unnamed protein product [Paramecium pentaurelia]|uniref:Transmembrane protein n=1 Tax=Paramecium pentaurelia TaxID=43138 RepID=A0A8S1U287_9CILI|nr:unnamed protein product [Paramecium pentaurelia]